MDKYSTTPVGKDTVVAIAVTKGRTSQAALKWTVENLLVEGHSLLLVNVIQRADFFHCDPRSGRHNAFIEAHSGIETQKGIQEGYKDILRTRAQEMFLPFQSYCKQKNIKSDVVLLEDNDLVGAIADFVLTNNVDLLVVGLDHRMGFSMYSRTALRPDLAKEFEFRSPLQSYSHSDFSIGGFSESESDISFVSSDRDYYDSSSSGYSPNSSNWSLDSFGGRPSYASSNSSNWGAGSVASSCSDSMRDGMVELQRIRLELIKK